MTTRIFRHDAQFLRNLCRHFELENRCGDDDVRGHLDEIADKLDIIAEVSFEPSRQLEGQAEELLHDAVKNIMNSTVVDVEGRQQRHADIQQCVMVGLWLLQRRMKAAGKSSFKGDLASLGIDAIASAFGEKPEDEKETDEHDNDTT